MIVTALTNIPTTTSKTAKWTNIPFKLTTTKLRDTPDKFINKIVVFIVQIKANQKNINMILA